MPNLFAALKSNRIRVLVADDHAAWVEALVAMLELDERLEVIGRAFDGAEALELARRLRPDVVLMDLEMPRLNGIEATRALRSNGGAPRVLMVTSSPAPEDVLAARDAGAIGYVLKGCTGDDLADLIVDAANRASQAGLREYKLATSAA